MRNVSLDPVRILLWTAVACVILSLASCSTPTTTIQSEGSATVDNSQSVARIDKLLTDMDVTFKAIESIKAEIRAGTQEKTDNSITEGDKIQAEAQQQGFFVFSWQEMAGGGAGVVAAIVLIVIILNVVKSKRIESEVSERADTQESARHARTLDTFDKVVHIMGEIAKAIAARGVN